MAVPAEPPPGMLAALGVNARNVARNRFDFLVELESEEQVRATTPDFTALKKVGARGIIVTAPADTAEFDFVSRFFAPGSGIDEDPVTGSAHCALGPYWAERMGKKEFTAYQASARGGTVKVRLNGDRVILGGQAVTVMTGELMAYIIFFFFFFFFLKKKKKPPRYPTILFTALARSLNSVRETEFGAYSQTVAGRSAPPRPPRFAPDRRQHLLPHLLQ